MLFWKLVFYMLFFFFFSSRRRHTRCGRDWSSDVCSSDLDSALIAEYKRYHEHVWPEIVDSIRESGIVDMEIYLLGTRMLMIMEVNERFSFEAKARADKSNPKVQEWE